jgi:DNA gyrase subunit A
MQDTASIIMLALVNNAPRVLSLREVIYYFIKHRSEIIERRTRFDLRKAEERAHIVEGLLKAIDNIDAVIRTIRASESVDDARTRLGEQFGFSEAQCQAILAMPLRRLTGLDRFELEKEYADLLKLIEKLRNILSSEKTILAEVRRETLDIKTKYGDERRTQILRETSEFCVEDLIPDETMVVTISNLGYIKRLPVNTYRQQRRGGKGMKGADSKEDDFIKDLFVASAHQYMLFFSTKGRVYWRKVHELPRASRNARGRAIVNLLSLEGDERVSACLPVRDLKEEGKMIFMCTRQGVVKKTELKQFGNPRTTGIIAITLDKADALMDVQITSGEDHILLATNNGMAIRFPEKDVRSMGRGAAGVKGIELDKGDFVIGVSLAGEDMTVLSVTENGFGKRTKIEEYRSQHRGGKGIINIKTSARNGRVVGMLTVDDRDDIVLVTTDGIVMRTSVHALRAIGRNTQGVRIMTAGEGATVSAVARAFAAEKEEEVTESIPDDAIVSADDENLPDDTD